MKLSKEELLQKINDKVMDEDVKIELLEDITDSFEISDAEEKTSDAEERVAELEEKYKNLQEKYKERFLSGEEKEEVEEKEEKEDTEELKEEEYIDVKEI